MRKYTALLLVVLVTLLISCAPQPALAVALESPANGSSASSLTPILAWTCSETGASYRVQVASDSNFQSLVIDEANLSGPSYAVPSGKLTTGQSYYWKVSASKGSQTSVWSNYWSFKTPTPPAATGTIVVNATLDGSPWSGQISYTITGPQANSGSSAPQTFSNSPAGTYAVSYSSGGPDGSTFADITPSPTGALSSGGTITFTLNFQAQPSNAIMVNATLNGSTWSGEVHYNICGPQADSGSFVPRTFSNLPGGTYTVNYRYGGPAGAALSSITPSPTQNLASGSTIVFTLNFHTQATNTVVVNATLNGATWSGQVRYTIDGPQDDASSSVPETFSNLPAGTYTVNYRYGGPAGARLTSITPSPTQSVPSGDTVVFTLNFYSQATTGTIMVNATLDGSTWSGQLGYSIHGPHEDIHSSVPNTFSNLPPGTYTIMCSGGPAGATLSSITPSPTQNLASGGTTVFTLNFHRQATTGSIMVNATLDGSPWRTAIGSGSINYTIHGPRTDSSTSVPDTFSSLPPGTYTIMCSGGPTGATLASITPSSSQNLPPNGTISFTLNFHRQAAGTVLVNATLNGSPWQGDVVYYVAGPYMDTSRSVPGRFTNCPAGTYTVTYSSGGPHQSRLTSITPSTQNLPPGGTIVFILNFTFQGGVLGG